MNNFQPIDPVKHSALTISTTSSKEMGDNVHIIDVIPEEFRNCAGYYPILISKNGQTGEFVFIALFGFEPGENLFLTDNGWDANYIPMNIARGPFSVDVQNDKTILCVNESHPKVGQKNGERLFGDDGQPSQYLRSMHNIIGRLIEGSQSAQNMTAKLSEYSLLEPLNVNLTFSDGSSRSLNGLYSISEKNLAQLTDEQVLSLHKDNLLGPIYAQLASLSQLGNLVSRKNNKLQGAAQ